MRHLRSQLPLILSAALLWLASGCASITTFQTANTIGKGRFQFGVEPSMYGATGGGIGGAVPHFDLSFRYGVGETVDIGARVGSSLLEVQSKFQLTDPTQTNFVFSLAPSVNGIFFSTGSGSTSGSGGLATISLPGMFGFGVGESQFIVSPRLQDVIIFGGGSSGGTSGGGAINSLLVGGSVGFALKLGDGFRLIPEVGLVYPVLSTAAGNGSSGGGGISSAFGAAGVLIYQAGIGIVLGGR